MRGKKTKTRVTTRTTKRNKSQLRRTIECMYLTLDRAMLQDASNTTAHHSDRLMRFTLFQGNPGLNSRGVYGYFPNLPTRDVREWNNIWTVNRMKPLDLIRFNIESLDNFTQFRTLHALFTFDFGLKAAIRASDEASNNIHNFRNWPTMIIQRSVPDVYLIGLWTHWYTHVISIFVGFRKLYTDFFVCFRFNPLSWSLPFIEFSRTMMT